MFLGVELSVEGGSGKRWGQRTSEQGPKKNGGEESSVVALSR